jgi:Ca-activated chloride channel family protein
MAHKFFILILVFAFAAGTSSAQSGRNRPTATPTPTPKPKTVYQPTQDTSKTPVSEDDLPPPIIQINNDDLIRVEASLVPIPVSVTDLQGRSINNLRIEDFELKIDGETAEIGEVFFSDTPVRLALLFDNSSSVTQARDFEIKAAKRFFRQVLRPDKDLAALFSVATGTRLEQPLTKDTSQLLRAIENLLPPKGATSLLDAIIESSNYLQDYQGRRIIVIVSDGEDNLSDATLEQAVKTAQVNNCQIYIVKTTDFENYKRTGNRAGNANIRYLSAEHRMQELASQTGGAVYSPIDERELDAAFERISSELSNQYILSYYPNDEEEKRGSFRNISVEIKEKNDLTIRTRKGYFVPRIKR